MTFRGGPADGTTTDIDYGPEVHVPVMPPTYRICDGAPTGAPHFQRAVYRLDRDRAAYQYIETLPCALCVQAGWA
jgi:hypothetical protein